MRAPREATRRRTVDYTILRTLRLVDRLVELLEADVMRVVSEASSADVQAVLSDQTVRVLANAAVYRWFE